MTDAALAKPNRIDAAEAFIAANGGGYAGVGESPEIIGITHRFTPGMYIRECRMPAGAYVVSKVHRTEHPFVVSQGRVLVYSESDGAQELVAPHTGITTAGTRRVLHVLEDTIWTTFHATALRDPVAIEREIIEPHENPLIGARAQERLT